jgi:arabinose-5-phosphate isomerase
VSQIPYSDWLLSARKTLQKEIQAIADLEKRLAGDFSEACEKILSCKGTVVLTGMGKSGLIARKWMATFSSTGTTSYFLNPAEASHGDLGILRPGDLLIALSFSGETEELANVIRYARETETFVIGVTGKPQSSLARECNLMLSVAIDEEACPLNLAPTASTICMMALGDALAVALMERRGFTEKDFARLHPGGSLGRRLWLRAQELMHKGDDLPIVSPSTPFTEVLMEMTRKRLGLAIVMDGRQVLGIVTDGDVRRHMQATSGKGSTAREMMTGSPKTIGASALAMEARELMEKNSIQHLLVYTDAEANAEEPATLLGVVHLQDLLKAKVV